MCLGKRQIYYLEVAGRDCKDRQRRSSFKLVMKRCTKVCLTSIDRDGKLLREKSRSWNDIKARKFMIINGHHSIIASKEVLILVEDRSVVLSSPSGRPTLFGAWTSSSS